MKKVNLSGFIVSELALLAFLSFSPVLWGQDAPALDFSVPRGFYEQSFDLTISTQTTDAKVRYTLDGSDPATASTANSSHSPVRLRIDPSVTLNRDVAPGVIVRACLVKDGQVVSATQTHTYLFLNFITQLSPDGLRPGAGWPNRNLVNAAMQFMDYGLDPDIYRHPEYRDELKASFLAVPTISLVTNLKNLFDPTTGIYVNALKHGAEWERPASVELLPVDNSEAFQINAGLRIRGGYSRHNNNPKHGFRLLFKAAYGAGKLRHPLFGDEGVDQFDNIDLTTSQNYSWAYEGDRRNTMLRDIFSRDTQRDMGQPYTRSRFYHLYLNGTYWGLYLTQERSEASYAAAYFGGQDDEYDVIKVDTGENFDLYVVEATDGTLDAWRRLWDESMRGFQDYATYFKVQGMNPDGTRNLNYECLLDVDNLIDYMLCTFFVGDFDGPISNFRGNSSPNNFYAIYNRNGQNGFKFFRHDAEHTLFHHSWGIDRTGPFPAGQQFKDSNPQWLHQKLAVNPEYRLRFADQAFKHFFNDGALTLQACRDRLNERKNEIEKAIVAESARWGDTKTHPPLSRNNHWLPEVHFILNEFLPTRSDVVLKQLGLKGLFPAFYPPTFDIPGGIVTSGTVAAMRAPAGTIYYTVDGTDPRQIPGVSNEQIFAFVPESASKRVLVPSSDIGSAWRNQLDFSDSDWMVCSGFPGGIGYEKESGYEPYVKLDVSGRMHSPTTTIPNPSCYIRTLFNLTQEQIDTLNTLYLNTRYDDGLMVYLNGGSPILSINAPANAGWNSTAMQNHEADRVESFNLTAYRNRLRVGSNLLAVQALNVSTTSSDFLVTVELLGGKSGSSTHLTAPGAKEYQQPFEITQTTQIKARVLKGTEWSALNQTVYIVQNPLERLKVTEIHYHPLDEGDVSGKEYEFIELKNTGNDTLNLSLLAFVKGIDYTFPPATRLHPRGFLVLASNAVEFEKRYRFAPFGDFSGQLDNAGERLVLVSPASDTVLSIKYDDKTPWPVEPDSLGFSLVSANLNPAGDPNDPGYWRVSFAVHGSPGADDLASPTQKEAENAPQRFVLQQNYPNPFNPSTRIRFSVPSSGFVELVVYDVTGRTVEVLKTGDHPAGDHSLEWSPRDLAGGIYFLVLRSGALFAVKKMTYLK